MKNSKKIYTIFSLLMIFILPVQASDIGKEKRWANQVVDFLIDGEPQWLVADGQQFFSIFTPAVTDKPAGAVILLHGRGVHPDWPQVIQPLRTQLPENYVPLFEEVPSRIQAGLDFLTQQNINNIVLIAHSLGASMATDYLSKHPDPRVNAFVGIGMYGTQQPVKYRVLDNTEALMKISIPVLDIYGSQTVKPILDSVDRRAYAIYHNGDVRSHQLEIKNASHFFQGSEDELVQSIASWMDETTKTSLEKENQTVVKK